MNESFVDAGVKQRMSRLGYITLGKGVDQVAYRRPGDNFVTKIFGTSDTDSSQHSEQHHMFKFWAEYCDKNKSNRFLPKFYGWEAFEFNDEKYLQIKMELLAELPTDIAVTLQDVFAYRGVNKDPAKRAQYFKDLMAMTDSLFFEQIEKAGSAQLAMLIGKKGFKQLWETIADIGNIGRKNSWGIDLHKGNFMMRANGMPVIVDPWAI